MRFLLLLSWLAFAVSANVLGNETSDGLQLEERTFRLSKRPRSKCGPKFALADNVASTLTSRNLGFVRLERNATALQKRMDFPISMRQFYAKELPRMIEIVTHGSAPSALDMNTAVMKSFRRLRGKEYSTGAVGLTGCTMMYIISRKGLYATHWWENVSFAPSKRWKKSGQTDDELFEATVLKMLKKGGTHHPKLDANFIEDDHIRAYLIHPTATYLQDGEGDVGYTAQWERIRTTVGEIIPTLKDRSRWTDIPYVVLEDEKDDVDKTRGRNLFKYDPNHKLGVGTEGPLAMLWVEGEIIPYHNDQW